MLKKLTFAVLATAMIFAAAPAMAQSIEIGPNGIQVVPPRDDRPRDYRPEPRRESRRDGISERRAARIARSEGMEEVEAVNRRRNVYIVEGVDQRGEDMRVVIDRYTGDVLSVR